jgi:hypothetical protein
MRLFGQLMSPVGILQRSLFMPFPGLVVALLIVLSSGAMGLRRKFMLFGGFSM